MLRWNPPPHLSPFLLLFCGLSWTVRTSEFLIFSSDEIIYRILIACIKYLANCLCPRCTVHTSEVSELGKKLDMRHRETKQRQDSEKHQSDVNAAREKIFKQGRIVEGEAVKKDLDKESYTTARVSLFVSDSTLFNHELALNRMHSHRSFSAMVLTIFACTHLTCFTSGVEENGAMFSKLCCECFSHCQINPFRF